MWFSIAKQRQQQRECDEKELWVGREGHAH